MDGIQDALDSTVATVFLYAFDAVILSYFISFPMITCLYHRPANTSPRCHNRPAFICVKDSNSDRKKGSNMSPKHAAVARTSASGVAPVLFPRRYSYMVANDGCCDAGFGDHRCVAVHRSSNFVRNIRLTTTV
ncbi:unnamed protein product [Gongylonema pulchrum]|uniref:SSD domain-containing protein n=1 Tax=Gongylonema pulchrum TaxID=637853 RepID=A0A183EB95_9BILA|nr:unnamed protein product [Gongylonema pulchrum]